MPVLNTPWGETINAHAVKQEYPRPRLVRDSYLNLNGLWDFCVSRQPVCGAYPQTILVPFSPEAPLSGVGHVTQPGEYLHYRRRFTMPEGFHKGRVLLHFGAVDQSCTVCVNGQEAGRNEGGYLPFTLDITPFLQEENTLSLTVQDSTEHSPLTRGKQKLVRRGKYASIFYTPQSGIWKTVWLESVPERHITGLRFTPLCSQEALRVEVTAAGGGRARMAVSLSGSPVYEGDIDTNRAQTIPLPGFTPWSPEHPALYDVTLAYGEDMVRSYSGMRAFEARQDARGIRRFFLNGRPFFFNGLLDQGYWPDSLMTAPSDEAIVHDILTAKSLGYNTLRKHVKIEEERFYYLCDKLGMAVWQDMPCGGGSYNALFVTYLPNLFNWFARGVSDRLYGLFRRGNLYGRQHFTQELKGMVEKLYHYPSIALWTPFNEGWGQFDARRATALIRTLDGTRLVNEACGWFDQGGGDLYAIHNYLHVLKTRPRPPRVVALTEYGGYARPVAGHLACRKEFGYKVYASREALTDAYIQLWEREIFPNLPRGLSAAIYTQVSDIEEEINGLVTYDRKVLKFDAEKLKALHRRLYDAFAAVAGDGAGAR